MLHAAHASPVHEETALGQQQNLSFASPSMSIFIFFVQAGFSEDFLFC